MEEETQPPGLIPPLDPVAADGAAGYQYDVDPDYVQVDPRSSRALAMFVLFNMVVISVIGYLVKKPYFPEIYVSGFDVSSISLSPNASSPADVFTVNLAFRNPNRVTGIKYYNLRAFLYYGERLITEASLSPFRQRLGGDVTHLKARLPERAAAGGYGAVDEATRFGVRVFLSINYTSVRFRSEPRFDLKTYCRDTGVSLNYTMPCSVRFTFEQFNCSWGKCEIAHHIEVDGGFEEVEGLGGVREARGVEEGGEGEVEEEEEGD
ncbi:uncharacterized protein A4U43_C02F5360 [Asparagus officinalis]|uniref:Late embryogenesis abundant protein LEA-2 subgroup domain-containing protein n=1 Tax=Asparagus officinalis TaxID=4686 RepID=A0A5P1FGW8_ASPOF|nr:uncharacterized protein A4U43_C02F5360 [Asparagus officinalis]